MSDLVAVLSRVGLDYLAKSLERTSRRNLELTNEEQQRLILARVLVAKPGWVISDFHRGPSIPPAAIDHRNRAR
jgi:ABC-type uncharacterized transport system fused permease/ATPase subunit